MRDRLTGQLLVGLRHVAPDSLLVPQEELLRLSRAQNLHVGNVVRVGMLSRLGQLLEADGDQRLPVGRHCGAEVLVYGVPVERHAEILQVTLGNLQGETLLLNFRKAGTEICGRGRGVGVRMVVSRSRLGVVVVVVQERHGRVPAPGRCCHRDSHRVVVVERIYITRRQRITSTTTTTTNNTGSNQLVDQHVHGMFGSHTNVRGFRGGSGSVSLGFNVRSSGGGGGGGLVGCQQHQCGGTPNLRHCLLQFSDGTKQRVAAGNAIIWGSPDLNVHTVGSTDTNGMDRTFVAGSAHTCVWSAESQR